MAVARLALVNPIRSLVSPSASGPAPSSIPLDKQAQDGAIAVNNYRASLAKWNADAQTARRVALDNIQVLYYLAPDAWKMRDNSRFRTALRARAGAELGDRMLNLCRSTPTARLSDNTIQTIAAAFDDVFAQPVASGPHTAARDMTRKASYAWEQLNQGTETSGQPDPAHPETTPLADVINAYGLRGLYWYVKAVPAVFLIARLRAAAPDWSQTRVWLVKLEPDTVWGVTQADRDRAAGEVSFSNPVTHLGNLRALASSIMVRTRALADGEGGPASDAGVEVAAQDSGGLPWGTIIVLLLIAGAVYWFVAVRKG